MQEKISGCLLKKGDWIYPEGHFAGFHRNDDGVRLPPVMCDPRDPYYFYTVCSQKSESEQWNHTH